jgi:hypothetical protein
MGGKVPNYWRWFFLILPKKMKDGKAKWQIVGDTLSGCSCGNLTSPRKSVPNFGVEIFGFYNKINLQEKRSRVKMTSHEGIRLHSETKRNKN